MISCCRSLVPAAWEGMRFHFGGVPDPMADSWWLFPFTIALVVGMLCPLAGTALLVQRRLFQVNLISHAVLPGLAIALFWGIEPGIGGLISGVLFALVAERMTSALPQEDRYREAVLNSVLAGSLGLGVLLIPLLGIRVDLEAVLFGDLLAAGPRELIQSLMALALIVILLAGRYRQYVYLGVDPVGAQAAGLQVTALRFLLTLVAAAAVVSAVSAVGIVLVVSLMAAPALLALPKARSLRQALLRSALWGLVLSGGGFVLAVQESINLPPGPVIGVVCMATLPLQLLRR